MANYSLSNEADLDIENHYEYGILTFGLEQAQNYMLAMHDSFELLADNPNLGRKADFLKENLYRFDFREHVIFYYQKPKGIHISRVLTEDMDFKRHL